MIGSYEAPEAFRNALEARLRNAAQERGIDVQRLQRQVAFERLLARLFAGDDAPWLLKGGYALELRLAGRARSTLDLDMNVPEPPAKGAAAGRNLSPAQIVYEQLQQAVNGDLNDGFAFRVGRPRSERTGAPGGGMRCSVEARLAGRPFVRFHLDIGLGDALVGQPEWVEGSEFLSFAGIPAARIALCPVDLQFAEKVHAYTYPWEDRDNTRVKDLVDLVLLVRSGQLRSKRVKQALKATFEVRGTHSLPAQAPVPPTEWEGAYEALAQELGLPAPTLREAHEYLAAQWQEWGLGKLWEPEG